MSKMAKTINVVIDEEIQHELEKWVPAEERDELVNQALKRELGFLRKRALTEQLMRLRASTSPMSTEEIVKSLREMRAPEN
jgi:hypothetical protein